MIIFKCKMCGGSLNVNENESYTTCEYCGTKQTLPKLDNDERANLYDRANHFRRNNEYDKASNIYEQILNQDSSDSEAYWSLALCRYGIEYVEDPTSRKRIPTVNRAQFTSIYSDENYKQAIEHADGYQKEIYETEASIIDEIQKNILSISQKESPFDVFICYKETDEQGRRTIDSVLANDLYHQLSQEGFKVFYSRITLEEKLGSAYEPYIFAALNSAKIMVVLGTKPEFFKAVWVKNEWSRYLGLIKSGAKKMLIPAYRGINPYDLPEEFSHLQALDMSKLGFMQDLIRGIKKIIASDMPKKESVITESINLNIAPLLKRIKILLEDKEWQKADEFCEQVLNQDPENANAYLYKMMAELEASNFEDLAISKKKFILEDVDELFKEVAVYVVEEQKCSINKITQDFGIGFNRATKIVSDLEKYRIVSKNIGTTPREVLVETSGLNEIFNQVIEINIEENINYNKIIKYGNKELIDRLVGIKELSLLKKSQKIYDRAKINIEKGDYALAIELLNTISGYKDAKDLKEICHEEIENERKQKIYSDAMYALNFVTYSAINNSIVELERISDYKDSKQLIAKLKRKIEEIEAKEEADKLEKARLAEERKTAAIARKNIIKKIALIILTSLVVVIIFLILLFTIFIPNNKYNEAIELIELGKYDEAKLIMNELDEYSDSEIQIVIIDAYIALESEDFEEGISLLESIGIIVNIDYNLDGGIFTELNYSLLEPLSISSDNPNKEGYAFNGWELVDYSINNTKNEYSAEIELKATYLLSHYSITFKLNGGVGVSNSTYNMNSDTILLANPTREGYTFIGWFDNLDFVGNPITEIVTGTTGDIILHASWIINEYTISFNSDGGSVVASIRQEFNTLVSEPTNPTKTNYFFDGWYTDIESTDKFTFNKMPAENVTLYAKWIYKYYTINYNPNGGVISSSSQEVEYNQIYNLLLPERENYVFLGWYASNTLFEDGIWTRKADVILIAHWDSIYEYTVSDDGVTITGFKYPFQNNTIVFPEEIFGKPVIQIGEVPTSIYSYSSKPIGISSDIINIIVPDCVQTIGRGAFNGASNLESITIPFVGESRSGENGYFNLGYIFGSEEFYNSYEARTWDGDLYEAGYYYLPNSLITVIITDTTILGPHAFHEIKNITSLILPENLESIGYMAFYSARIGSSIILPLSVISIDKDAFDWLGPISSFTIYVRATSRPTGWHEDWVDYEERVVWGYTDDE